MPWAFLVITTVYGIFSLIFAFAEPPTYLRSIFTVPRLFIFLPDRLVMPVGRVFVGVASLGLVAFMAVKLLAVAP